MNSQAKMGRQPVSQGSGADAISRLAALPSARPRVHKFSVGDFECIVLSDGGIPVPKSIMTADAMSGAAEFVLFPLSCLLVRTPNGQHVLIDSGFGPNPKRGGFPLPTGGRALESMAMSGVAPGDIDVVLASHLHPDHVNGMYSDEGAKIYPNATYYAGAEEVAFWSQDNLNLSASPAPGPVKQDMISASRRLLNFAKNSLQLFHDGEDILPGIGAMLVPGHTPGQTAFILSSGGEKLLYTADAFAMGNSVESPEWHGAFDLDPQRAAETRGKLVTLLAEPQWRSFTPHFEWPNVWRLNAKNVDTNWILAT